MEADDADGVRTRADKAESTVLRILGMRAMALCGVLATLLHADPAPAHDAVEQILALVSQEKYVEARAALDPMLERSPGAPRLRLMNGLLSAREGKTVEAMAIFEDMRNDRPDMFEPYNNLAVLYARQGRLDSAREALVAALERRPDAVAYANLGEVYTRLAKRAYARARQLGGAQAAARAPAAGTSNPPPPDRPRSQGAAAKTLSLDSGGANSERPAGQAPPSKAPNWTEGPLSLAADAAGDATADAPASAAGPAASQRCLRAHRFDKRAVAMAGANWLKAHGADLSGIRHEARRVVNSYRVYLPAPPTGESAASKLNELRRQGLGDVALIRNGPRAGEISLGVYKSRENMRRRVAQLKKLGYAARTAENVRTRREFVVDARTDDGPGLASKWRETFPDHPIRYVDCL